MGRTPDDFVSEVRGKKYDIDGVYGAQCVDGFKKFLQWASIPVYTAGNNRASGYWKYRKTNGSSKYFEFISNYKNFKNGDWVIWDTNAFSGTHIAMYYNGKAFGQNQHQKESDRGFSMMSVSTSTMSKALGALRWKNWEYTGTSVVDASADYINDEVGYQPLQVNIDPSVFKPYLITIERDSSVPYSKLQEAGVIGAAVEAGYLYTSIHNKVIKYENPNTGTQIKSLEKYNIPYGWFMPCRAKTSVEAKEEIYQFSFPVRRHPPKLGVWLKLELRNSKSINNGILDVYKKELMRLGFTSKMGIMCERSMLSNIDWSTLQNDFYLWLIEHVSNVSQITELMDPQFFDIDRQG